MSCLTILSRHTWGSRVSPGSFITSRTSLSFLALVSLLALHAAHVHLVHGARLAGEPHVAFVALEARVSPGSRRAGEAVVPFGTWQSWHARWPWRAGLPRSPHDSHLSLGTWNARLAGGALLSRKARQPRLPRQAGEPLGPFVSFGAWHVQAWEAREAFLSFHSGGA